MVISCPECSKKFQFKGEAKSGSRFRCASCGAVFSCNEKGCAADRPGRTAFKVVAATGNCMIAEAVRNALSDRMVAVEVASDGGQVMEMISKEKPHLLILDAAIQGLFSFTICEIIKKDPKLSDIKIILTSAAFNKSRYKRKPSELFGAEQYIEAHMLEHELAGKAGELLGIEIKAVPETIKTEAFEEKSSAQDRVLRLDGEKNSKGAEDTDGKARTLARIIAADILLYNRKKLNKKLEKKDALAMFSQEIGEAVKYFSKRLPGADTAYIHAAIEECLESINKVPAKVSACRA